MATTAERDELAYNILMEVSDNNVNAAHTVKRYYANVMPLDENDHFIARGMIRAYEDGYNDGYDDGVDETCCY